MLLGFCQNKQRARELRCFQDYPKTYKEQPPQTRGEKLLGFSQSNKEQGSCDASRIIPKQTKNPKQTMKQKSRMSKVFKYCHQFVSRNVFTLTSRSTKHTAQGLLYFSLVR